MNKHLESETFIIAMMVLLIPPVMVMLGKLTGNEMSLIWSVALPFVFSYKGIKKFKEPEKIKEEKANGSTTSVP